MLTEALVTRRGRATYFGVSNRGNPVHVCWLLSPPKKADPKVKLVIELLRNVEKGLNHRYLIDNDKQTIRMSLMFASESKKGAKEKDTDMCQNRRPGACPLDSGLNKGERELGVVGDGRGRCWTVKFAGVMLLAPKTTQKKGQQIQRRCLSSSS